MKKSIAFLSAALLLLAFTSDAPADIPPPSISDITPGWAPAGSPVALHGQLKAGRLGGNGIGVIMADGGQGSPVTLRGMSFFWSNSMEGGGYYNDAVVGYLTHDWNVSVVRAAMGIHRSEGGGNAGYMDGDSSGQTSNMKRVIEGAIRRGIYVIVDWHMHCISFAANTAYGTPAFSAADTEAKAIQFFTNIAKEYGRYPNVLFELWNEPDVAGKCAADWNTIRNYSNRVVPEIRKHSDNLILVGTRSWSSIPDQNEIINNRVADSKNNIAYVMHFYAGNSAHRDAYRTRTQNMLDAGLPVFVTEFGSTHSDGGAHAPNANPPRPCPGGSHPAGPINGQNVNCNGHTHNGGETDIWINWMNDRHVGWVNWSVTHKNEGASALYQPGNANFPWELSDAGDYIRAKIKASNAVYAVNRNTVTASVVGNVGGQVAVQPGGPYTFNQEVTITATPNNGWDFDGWSGDASGVNLQSFTHRLVGIPVSVSAKFVQSSMIKNGTFSSVIAPWTVTPGAPSVEGKIENGELMLTINSSTEERADHRVAQGNSASGIEFQSGEQYKLTFRARGDSPRPIGVMVTNTNRVQQVASPRYFDLTTVMQDFCYEFTAQRTTPATGSTAGTVTFIFGGNTTGWYLDYVRLDSLSSAPGGSCNSGSSIAYPITPPGNIMSPGGARPGKMTWSAFRTAGGVQLRGPADAGAVVTMYDTRGRVVRSMRAADGLVIGRGISSGNYLLVVRSGAGGEVLRTRVSLVR